jgi:transcription antitermination protein NusB
MINRRSLRIKAFKNLYAYESCKGANYMMALDLIDQKFSPDLNSMEVIDKPDLERKRKLARTEFENHFHKAKEERQPFEEEVEPELTQALEYLERQNLADLKKLSKDLREEAERVFKDQLIVLSILEELAFLNKKLSDEKKTLTTLLGEKAQIKTNLYTNKVVGKLKSDETYQKSKIKHKISWANQQDTLRDWYKGTLNKDEQYREYNKKESTNYDEDWLIVDYICRGVIFKKDVFSSYFEDIDLDWPDNHVIVRSLVLKTLKSAKDEGDQLQIADISYNWDEDSEYVQELFKMTIKENDYLEELLKDKLRNWDIERVALTDKVLMKMALVEMIFFPSIPTKVTINEFIEISKTFSTPKSKKFLNGILDGLSIELVNKGVIRKSGRGLLDNK